MRMLMLSGGLLTLAGCANFGMPDPDPSQAWIDLDARQQDTALQALQVDTTAAVDKRYFEVQPGSHELKVRYQFPVEATNIGHYNYLYGDRKAADAMIQKINPDISDEYIEKSIPVLRAHMDVGDAPTKGIGAISDARMKDFYDKTVEAGLYKPTDFNYKDAYTTQFVNKGTGLDIRKALVK